MEYFDELGDHGYFDQDYDVEYSVRITNSSSLIRSYILHFHIILCFFLYRMVF